jgi:dTDP-4-dehydrorhamnose 3,5-epimerase
LPFAFTKTPLEGVLLIVPQTYEDERGFFMEAYSKSAFVGAGIAGEWVQQNHSRSVRGVLRGLHFQKEPFAQAKLVRCTRGEVFDVAVDMRRHSPTFGKHVTVTLSESNKKLIYVPRGFAHGFLTESDIAEVQYGVDNEYAPDHEGGIIWNDPGLGIDWPTRNPTLSKKDASWPRISQLKRSWEIASNDQDHEEGLKMP